MNPSDSFERYGIWPIRLRVARGLDLVSLWGRDANRAGDDFLLARGGRILVSLTPEKLVTSVTSSVVHNMSRWKGFAAFRSDFARNRRAISLRVGLLHDFPMAIETMDALASGKKISHIDSENILLVLNLLWDVSRTLPDVVDRSALVGRTALGRLAEKLTFRSAGTHVVWRKSALSMRTKQRLFTLLGNLTLHCEVV